MTVIVVLFFALTLLLFLLPFLPGLFEVRARRDAGALPVSATDTVDIRHFAHGFRTFVDREMGEPLARVRETGMRRSGWIEDQGQYYVLPARERLELFADEDSRREIDRILAAVGDLDVPAGLRCLRELYAGGTVRVGALSEVRAALAEEDVILAEESRSIRWLHAGRDLDVRTGAVLRGRASADRKITLAPGVTFERLHAPTIRLGVEGARPLPRAGNVVGEAGRRLDCVEWRPDALGTPHELAAGRLLVEGDLEIPAHARVRFDLVVWGSLTIGTGAQVDASVKSHGPMRLGRDVGVAGSVVGQGDVTLDDDVAVDGPVIAEERLTIGAFCVIGTVAEPSTVRAGSITVRAGSVIHGTAWASGRGEVIP